MTASNQARRAAAKAASQAKESTQRAAKQLLQPAIKKGRTQGAMRLLLIQAAVGGTAYRFRPQIKGIWQRQIKPRLQQWLQSTVDVAAAERRQPQADRQPATAGAGTGGPS